MSGWITPPDMDPHKDAVDGISDPWGDEGLEGTVRRVRATLPPPVPATTAVGGRVPSRPSRVWVWGRVFMVIATVVGVFVLVGFAVTVAISAGWLS